MAAAFALANLARLPVTEKTKAAYKNKDFSFGKEYILPVPFDERLIETVPAAVAKAAMETGVARLPVTDWDAYAKAAAQRIQR